MSDPLARGARGPRRDRRRHSHPHVYDLLIRLEEIRAQIDLLAEEAARHHAAGALVHRSRLYADETGVPWRATVVRPDDTVLVNLEMVKRLDPQLYEQITVTALNRKALNKALRAGQVNARSPAGDGAASQQPLGPADPARGSGSRVRGGLTMELETATVPAPANAGALLYDLPPAGGGPAHRRPTEVLIDAARRSLTRRPARHRHPDRAGRRRGRRARATHGWRWPGPTGPGAG